MYVILENLTRRRGNNIQTKIALTGRALATAGVLCLSALQD
jgi:hypothetical protein